MLVSLFCADDKLIFVEANEVVALSEIYKADTKKSPGTRIFLKEGNLEWIDSQDLIGNVAAAINAEKK
jgi:hypothetical protein